MKNNLSALLSPTLPEIIGMGFMLFDPLWGDKMHSPAHCELIYIMKGRMTLESAHDSVAAEAGDLLLVEPDLLHRDVFNPESGLEVYFLSFKWSLLKYFLQNVSNQTIQAISPLVRTELSVLFDQLRIKQFKNSELDQCVAQSHLQTILLILLRESISTNASEEPDVDHKTQQRQDLMQRAKSYLEEHYAECIALDDIAAALHVNGYHLSRVFSEENNCSLFATLTTLRIEKAKALLGEGRLHVSAVAHAVGYESANYFAKVFRKHCGLSPSEYIIDHSDPPH